MKKENWNLQNMPYLSGKTILVTGANSGLGYESTKAFASKNAEVIMACRNTEKGEKAKKEIIKHYPNANLKVKALDLMNLDSVKSFAEEFKSENDKLDILLNNAGIMTTPYFVTKNGFEAQFGTNHLGHFVLTSLLFEKVASTPSSRIVNVASLAHKGGIINFGDLNYGEGKNYSAMTSYRRSKIANLYFSYELQRKIEAAGLGIKVISAHPGASNTNLAQFIDKKWWFKILTPLVNIIMQEADQGALPQIRACVDENAKSGEYYGPDGFGEMKGKPVLVDSTKEAKDEVIASKLWTWSEELTGYNFKI